MARPLLPVYKFFEHLFATPDSDVVKLLKELTFLYLEEIGAIKASMGRSGYIPNTAQRRLAEEVTRFVHGDRALQDAQRATEALAPGSETQLDSRVVESIAKDVPSFSLARAEVLGSSLVDVCVRTELQASKAAPRRLIKQGGLYLSNKKIVDDGKTLDSVDLVDNRMLLLSAGKKNKLVMRLQ